MINSADLLALSPLITVAATAVAVMLAAAFRRHHRLAVLLTLLGLALAFALAPVAALVVPRQVTPLLVFDRYALFYIGLLCATGAGVTALSHNYLEGRSRYCEEFYILLLVATLGALVLVTSHHFAALFLGLELLSVSLFALIAYPVDAKPPLEAGLKYLVLSGVSSAFLLFGIALIYAELGTLSFASVGALLSTRDYSDIYLITGLALLVAGLGFKLSLVPFHLWTPDVYQGAPAPVTAFVATVSKGAVFALLLRYFMEAQAYRSEMLLWALSLIAVASMLIGNLLALLADNVKRILAYSSIAHVGYLLVALIAGGALAVEAVTYYLVAYFVTTVGAFGVVTLMSGSSGDDADTLPDYQGLFWRRPWLAGLFTAMLLSLAGIPLTAGFVAKFYVFAAGVHEALWLLLITLVIGSAVGLFYYLRIVIIMTKPSVPLAQIRVPTGSLAGGVVLAVLALLLLWLGLYPTPLMNVIQTAGIQLI